LNVHQFTWIAEAQHIIEVWRLDFLEARKRQFESENEWYSFKKRACGNSDSVLSGSLA